MSRLYTLWAASKGRPRSGPPSSAWPGTNKKRTGTGPARLHCLLGIFDELAAVRIRPAVVHDDLTIDPNVISVQAILRNNVVVDSARLEVVQLVYPLTLLLDLGVLTVDINSVPTHRNTSLYRNDFDLIPHQIADLMDRQIIKGKSFAVPR